jgi:putative transposase
MCGLTEEVFIGPLLGHELEAASGLHHRSVDQELLLRNEHLATENRILRNQVKGRLRLTNDECMSLAELGKPLGRKVREEVAQIVRPETILAWHRKLVAKKFDG